MSLRRIFEWLGLLIITPFGLKVLLVDHVAMGAATLLVSAALAVALLLPQSTDFLRWRELLTTLVPAGVLLAFAHTEPFYASYWSFPFVLYLYFQMPLRWAAVINGVFLLALLFISWGGLPHEYFWRLLGAQLALSSFAFFYALDRERREKHLTELATTDPLTGLYNRRFCMDSLQQVLQSAARYSESHALLIIDVDHFKLLNDEHGHLKGDEVLIELALFLKRHLRQSDMVARLGGEEFLLLLRHTTAEQAKRIADALIAQCRTNRFPHGQPMTVSLGVAVNRPGETLSDWLRRADRALYAAKDAGRDCCRVANSATLAAAR